MLKRRASLTPWMFAVVGGAAGLLVGVGVVAGTLVAFRSTVPRVSFPLNATATHGGSTMALATGAIDQGVEGLFVLDFITGELQCTVLNPRTGQMGGMFRTNVVADLGAETGKQPKFLLVVGKADFRFSGGNVRPAESVVYVADENTGRFAAYMLPWNRQASQYNFAQISPMVLLGKGAARNIELE